MKETKSGGMSFLSGLQEKFTCLWCIPVLTLVGAIIRFYHLSYKALWLDEVRMLQIANGNMQQVIEKNIEANSAPPLFAVLLNQVLIFGMSESWLRLIPCLASIASIPVIYVLAKQFVERQWACLAAALVVLAPTQVYYAQQTREYSLAFFLSAALVLAFTLFIRRPSLNRSLGISILAVISILTQYGLVLIFVACNFVALFALIKSDKRRTAYKLWLIPQVFGLVACILVYHISLKYHLVEGGRAAYYLGDSYWNGSFLSLFYFGIKNSTRIIHFSFPSTLSAFLIISAIVTGVKKGNQKLSLAFLLMPLAIVFFCALLRYYPYGGIRQCIILLPMCYVFIALGVKSLAVLRERIAWHAVIAVLFLFWAGVTGVLAYHKSLGVENIHPVVKELKRSLQPDDIIYVYCGAVPAFGYYWKKEKHQWVRGGSHRDDPDQYLSEIKEVLKTNRPVWLVFSHTHKDESEKIVYYVGALRELRLVVDVSPSVRLYYAKSYP